MNGRRIAAATILVTVAVPLLGAAVNSILQAAQQPWPTWTLWFLGIGGVLVIVALLILVPRQWWRKGKDWVFGRPNWIYGIYNWRHYHPKVTLLSYGNIVITEFANSKYRLRLNFALSIKNRDASNQLYINFKEMQMKIFDRKIKGRKQSYTLIYEGDRVEVLMQPCEKIEKLEYTIVAFSNACPQLGSKAKCDKIRLGTALLMGIERPIVWPSFAVTVTQESSDATS